MEAILKEHERLENKANLGKAVVDVQKIIDQLEAAKAQVLAGMYDPAPVVNAAPADNLGQTPAVLH